MSTTLEALLPGDGEAMPAAQETPPPAPQEPEKTEQEAAPQGGEQADEGIEVEHEGQRSRMVPKQALDEARGKVKRYTEQVAEFQQQLKESNDAWERRLNMVLERFNPPQQPQPEPQAAPDWFADPDAAMQHRLRDALTQTIAPQFQAMNEQLMAAQRQAAEWKTSESDVAEAEKAFMQAMQTRALDPADYQKVINSPNRFAAAVQWHKRQQTQAEIGDDPVAYKERLKAELLAELQQQSGTAPAAPAAPAMPSNFAAARSVGKRASSVWQGPQPLGSIFKE